jgi:hypothetical protein
MDITNVLPGEKYFALEAFKKRRKFNFVMGSAIDTATEITSHVEQPNLNGCILTTGALVSD